MRKEVLLIVLLFVFISFASAACIDSNQTIMKLYSENNTHGALWNQSYSVDICYDEIFGKAYTPANPHDCTGTNTVLKLSNEYNAHAGNSTSNYAFSVCYGDLNCMILETGVCGLNGMEVVRLSSPKNAHLSIGGSYQYVVCCGSIFANVIPTTAHWRDMTGANIDGGNVNVNDSVILYAKTDLPNVNVAFSVYSKTGGTYPIRVGANAFTNTSNQNGEVSYVWKITQSDMTHLDNGKSEFYFNVTGVGIDTISSSLFVNNSATNTKPNCAILSPTMGSVYFKDSSVILAVLPNAGDPDSTVSINWAIVDADNGTIEGSASGESANYTLSSTGTKIVGVSVIDDSGAYCYNETGISVTKFTNPGDNPRTEVFAWINSPTENQTIMENAIIYDANSSYAYNLTGTNCASLVFTCLGGNCPPQINCDNESYYLTSLGYGSLNFNWFFDGTLDNSVSGAGKSDGAREYTYTGSKTIKVDINIYGTTDSKTRRFTIVSGCERPQVNQAWVVSILPDGTVERNNPIVTGGTCKGKDNTAGNSDDCCPDGGWICSKTTVLTDYLCMQPSISPEFCEDYTNSSDCKADLYGVGTSANYGEKSPDLFALLNCSKVIVQGEDAYTVFCGETSSGAKNGCAWHNSSCWLNTSYQKHERGIIVTEPGCLYKSVFGECTAGYQTVDISGESTVTPPSLNIECSTLNGQYTVLCGRTGVKLPFFGAAQFIVALTIIITVYISVKIFHKKKKR